MSNEVAPKGKAWVCAACGKVSRDQYGDKVHSFGWDESCMLNCILTDDLAFVKKLERLEEEVLINERHTN